MRLAYITAPIGFITAAAGLGMMYVAKTHAAAPPVALDSTEWKLAPAEPRHAVTPEMWKKANGAIGMTAPDFTATDTGGQVQTLDDLTKNGPLFMYFVLDGCPCSIEAEPHYEHLSEQFHGSVKFLVISSAKESDARKWKSEFGVPYPVVSQSNLELMHLYGVTNSVYCLLIGRDKKIVKMWPGYSASMLDEANAILAKTTGEKLQPFDVKLAPKIMTSGCPFPQAKKS
jgi:peroxiredoxin